MEAAFDPQRDEILALLDRATVISQVIPAAIHRLETVALGLNMSAEAAQDLRETVTDRLLDSILPLEVDDS